ncbi:MAG TPA: hypothetical protein VEI01_08975 [Terriglobales bacterium]|nr:hypothetical protein [Terriglobales bacterium]
MARRVPRLGEEIREQKLFSSPAEEALWGLQCTADVVRRGFAEVAEARGISLQQYNVLRILRAADAAGMPTLEIAERMIEKTPGITRLWTSSRPSNWCDGGAVPRTAGRCGAGSLIPAAACWLNSTNPSSTQELKPRRRSRHWN